MTVRHKRHLSPDSLPRLNERARQGLPAPPRIARRPGAGRPGSGEAVLAGVARRIAQAMAAVAFAPVSAYAAGARADSDAGAAGNGRVVTEVEPSVDDLAAAGTQAHYIAENFLADAI